MSIAPQKNPETSHSKRLPNSAPKKFLGIDFGRRDIGLAIADGETRIAFAYKTLLNDKNFLQGLAEIISQEGVVMVIIGIPSHINREEVEYEAERLGEVLENELGVQVEYQNEMFTTKMAQAKLIEKGIKGIKRFDDQEAASIILQDWLDKKK